MSLPETEQFHPQSRELASLDPLGVIELMDAVEPATLAAIGQARPRIVAAPSGLAGSWTREGASRC